MDDSKISKLLDSLSPEEYEATMKILNEVSESGRSNTLNDIYHSDFTEIPVSIDEFIDSPRYAGWFTNNGHDIYQYWRERLREIFDENASYSEIAFTGCLSGDTMIPLLNGTSVSMKDLADRDKLDEYVYSYDVDTNRIVAGHLVDAFSTGTKKVYKITLDNGESFKCTSNHRFLTRDKHWKSIDSGLKIDDSLMPLYRDKDSRGYEIIHYPKKNGLYEDELTHRMSMRSKMNGFKFKGTVHHKDFNKINNDPRNLLLTTWSAHRWYHCLKGGENLRAYNEAYRNGTASEDSVSRARAGALKGSISRWSDPIQHEEMSVRTTERMLNGFSRYMLDCKKSNPECVVKLAAHMADMNRNPDIVMSQQVAKACKIAKIALDELGEITKETFNLTRKNHGFGTGYPSFDSAISRISLDELRELAQLYNHRIMSIEYIGEEEVYDLTVERYHNFALEYGIFAHNSIGCGKSHIAVLGLAYCLYRLMCLRDPHAYYGIAKGGLIYIVFFNNTLALSQGVAYTKFQSLVQHSPWFLERGQVTGKKYLEYIPDGNKISFSVGSGLSHSIGKDILCISGDTKILTDKGIYKISELSGKYVRVFSISDNGIIELSNPALVAPTKYTNDIYEIELEDGSKIKCTGNHLFMLKDGTYKRADELTIYDELMEESFQHE